MALLSASTHAADLQSDFTNLIQNALGSAQVLQSGFELRVLDRATGQELASASVNRDAVIYPASSIKTLVALATYRRIDRNELTLDQPITITQNNANPECQVEGNCAKLGYGKRPTVAQLLESMITVSSNIATNQLFDTLTKDFIDQTAELMELHQLRFNRKLYSETPPQNPMPPLRNAATARDLAGLYEEISTGRRAVLSETSRASLTALLARQEYHDRMDRNWKSDPFFYHKPGNTSAETSDAGFFYFGPGKNRIVILTGLQAFASFKEKGQTTSGYTSLSRVGDGVLKILRTSMP